ncbi:MAG: type II toxin-antitoxin system VapC family toxin [Verrucomicrobia bacterium]|nr:type II toxin-antitoxin system VapC family toxin [Verrucomicrobiota bacterium]
MIVVDVNTIAYLWIPGDMTKYAERALEIEPQWSAPTLWHSEFRRILTGYLRRGQLDMHAVTRCLEGAESQLTANEYVVPSLLVMNQVRKSECSAYDCEYVALADDLKTQLVTTDRQILREFPKTAISLKDFTET